MSNDSDWKTRRDEDLAQYDGSVIDITGGYGGYSGNSCDEYVELISVDRVP